MKGDPQTHDVESRQNAARSDSIPIRQVVTQNSCWRRRLAPGPHGRWQLAGIRPASRPCTVTSLTPACVSASSLVPHPHPYHVSSSGNSGTRIFR